MDTTPKKRFERNILERFLRIYPDMLSGEILNSESPDFLIRFEDQTIGIEIINIVNEKGIGDIFSPMDRNSLEREITKETETIFMCQYKIPLHVDFAFNDSLSVSRKNIKVLANKLAMIIGDIVVTRSLNDYFRISIDSGLPKELKYLSISYYPKVTHSVWYSAKGMLLHDLKKEQILRVIGVKEDLISEYKLKADQMILLLVEGELDESWFDEIEAIMHE